jgi:hypothetical protein
VTRILAIHGVRNYRNGDPPVHGSQRIAAAWHAALSPHLPGRRLDLQAAYYADRLRSDAQGDELRGQNLAEQELIDQLLADWAAAWQITTADDQGPLTVPLRVLFGKVAERAGPGANPGLVDHAARLFFPEVARYLGYAPDGRPHRHAVRHRVAQALTAHQPDVVIAHSLGTVVAYETLHAYPDQQVPLLITLGSPLALPGAIFPRLDPAPTAGTGRKPPGVERWIDLADTGDVIAVPRGALPRVFTGVDEHHEITIGLLALHDVGKYLAHPRLISYL